MNQTYTPRQLARRIEQTGETIILEVKTMNNKINAFKVRIEIDKFNSLPYLCSTHNGRQWTSVRIEDPKYELPLIIKVLEDYLKEMP